MRSFAWRDDVLHEGACAAELRGGKRGGAARGQAGKVTWGQGGETAPGVFFVLGSLFFAAVSR
jgi:hypothetical protein